MVDDLIIKCDQLSSSVMWAHPNVNFAGIDGINLRKLMSLILNQVFQSYDPVTTERDAQYDKGAEI